MAFVTGWCSFALHCMNICQVAPHCLQHNFCCWHHGQPTLSSPSQTIGMELIFKHMTVTSSHTLFFSFSLDLDTHLHFQFIFWDGIDYVWPSSIMLQWRNLLYWQLRRSEELQTKLTGKKEIIWNLSPSSLPSGHIYMYQVQIQASGSILWILQWISHKKN